jgi:hypothetical protein
VTVSSSGQLTVRLSDAGANGYVIADAIRLAPVTPRIVDQLDEFTVVDNGDPAYGCTNGSLWTGYAQAWDGELQQLEGGTTERATWSVDVEPGLYEVAVSWSAYTNRATNAPYTISAAEGSGLTTWTGTLNQRYMAQQNQGGTGAGTVQVNGTWFQYLTRTFEVPALSKSLTVEVTNGGNGKIIADAVFVRRVGDVPQRLVAAGKADELGAVSSARVSDPAESSDRRSPPVASGASNSVTGGLTPAVRQAAQWWLGQDLDARQRAALSSVEYIVADLRGDTLGLASPEARRIWIDRDAAGRGWGGAGMDLATVVAHELGHVLGYADIDAAADDLMSATLPAGARRLAAVDAVFGEVDW